MAGRGFIIGVNTGFLKLIFSLETRRLFGAYIIGEIATELIHIGHAVNNVKGTVDFFVNNTFNYPTLAEAIKLQALMLGTGWALLKPSISRA